MGRPHPASARGVGCAVLAPAGPVAWGRAILTVLLACAVLLFHARHYLPFIADDALISLRYADRFLHGSGLTWNDGERVEGYSNLLWILSVSALGRCGMDLIVAVRLLGGLAMAAVMAAVVAAFPPRHADATATWASRVPLAALVGTLAIALTGSAAAWTIGGLEQPLLAALLAWAVVLLLPVLDGAEVPPRRMVWPGVLLGLAVLTRVDAPLWTVLACLGVLAARGLGRRNLARVAALAAVPGLCFLAQLGFRLAYYHDWLPNSAHAKVAFTAHRLVTGVTYVAVGSWSLWPLIALAGVGAVAGTTGARRGRTIAIALLAVGWLAYVAVIGGDIFPAWRHLLVAVVLASLLAAGGVARLTSGTRSRPVVAWALALVMLPLLAVLQSRDAENIRAQRERWEWDGEVVGRMLKSAFGREHPLLAVDPAGCVPYFSGLPSIDMLGINDRWLATHPPADFGEGWLGHELGNGAYVLGRRPDLVLFGGPAGLAPGFRSAREMTADPRFFADFQLVQFASTVPRPFKSSIWVRREGGAVGIRRASGRVEVPGFLLAPVDQLGAVLSGAPGSPTTDIGSATLEPSGSFACEVREGMPCVLQRLPMPPGRWRIHVEPASDAVRLRARCGAVETSADARGRCTVDITDGAGTIDMAVSAEGAPTIHVRRLVLERLASR